MNEKALTNPADPKGDFIAAVRREFSYLSQYGFEESSANRDRVAWTKGDWTIAVYYISFQYDLGISIYLSNEHYEIYEYMAALDPEAFSKFSAFQAATPQEVSHALAVLSEMLKKYGMAALVGDPNIVAFVRSKVEEYKRKMQEE